MIDRLNQMRDCGTAITVEHGLCCCEWDAVISPGCTGEGGQIDFIRGAALGYDGLGKPIIAMHSVTPQGESKIVPTLKPGAVRCDSESFILVIICSSIADQLHSAVCYFQK